MSVAAATDLHATLRESEAASDPLEHHVSHDDRGQRRGDDRAELTGAGDHAFDRLAGAVPQGHPGSRPEEGPRAAVDRKSEHTDAHDARQRRPHGAKAGDELGEQEERDP
jgi:hypothetical protein